MPFVGQGGSVTPDVYVRTANQQLTDPDTGTLTLTIKDPDGDVLAGFPVTYPSSGFVRLGLGHYEYTWLTSPSQAEGTYDWLWNGDVNGAPVPTATEEVEVLPSGSIGPESPLMTVAQLREHVTSRLADSALQRLIDANTLAITERAGAIGSASIVITGNRSRYIFLDRPISTITSITEFFNDPVGIGGVVLDSTDYRIQTGGLILERWGYGTHPADWWSERAELVYVPVDDSVERVRVLIKLIELDLNRQPGLSAVRIGEYSEQSRNEPYNDEREAILASLVPSVLSFA